MSFPGWLAALFVAVGVVGCSGAWAAPQGSGWQVCARVGESAEHVCSLAAESGKAVQQGVYGRVSGLCSQPLDPATIYTGAEGQGVNQSHYIACYSDDYSQEFYDAPAAPWVRYVYISPEAPASAASAGGTVEDWQKLHRIGYAAFGVLALLLGAAGYATGLRHG